MPGSPPSSTSDPGTKPPPSTRSNSSIPVERRAASAISTSVYSFADPAAPSWAYRFVPPADAGASAVRSSTSEFHAPHSLHRPSHFWRLRHRTPGRRRPSWRLSCQGLTQLSVLSFYRRCSNRRGHDRREVWRGQRRGRPAVPVLTDVVQFGTAGSTQPLFGARQSSVFGAGVFVAPRRVATSQMSLREAMAVFLLATIFMTGCSSGPAGPSDVSHGGPVNDFVSLVDTLRAAGAAVDASGTVSQPSFAPQGQLLTVEGEDVQVFEFHSVEEANTVADTISPDGRFNWYEHRRVGRTAAFLQGRHADRHLRLERQRYHQCTPGGHGVPVRREMTSNGTRQLALRTVLPFYPRADAADDLVGNRPDRRGHFAHVDLLPRLRALAPDKQDFVRPAVRRPPP